VLLTVIFEKVNGISSIKYVTVLWVLV